MISHRNVISNTMQYAAHESVGRKKFGVDTQAVLGLLPFSHIYGLVVIAHGCPYRGDAVIVLPKFEMPSFLGAIERFKINHLLLVSFPEYKEVPAKLGELTHSYQVPPIVIRMTKSYEECKKYNLDSVRLIFSGAAPLGEETAQDVLKLWPKWRMGQGYGTLTP